MSNEELIRAAASVLRPHRVGDRLFGDVGAALVCDDGSLFTGVCVDTPGWGLCAERSALSAMITAGQYRVRRIVAVWRGERDGKLYVLPPCGVCREFLRQVDPANLGTEVVLGLSVSLPLRDLLPHSEWPQPLEWLE